MGFSLQRGHHSSFTPALASGASVILHSSLLFWREKVLSALGLRAVRFRNDEVMRGLSAVAGKIKEFIIVLSVVEFQKFGNSDFLGERL